MMLWRAAGAVLAVTFVAAMAQPAARAQPAVGAGKVSDREFRSAIGAATELSYDLEEGACYQGVVKDIQDTVERLRGLRTRASGAGQRDMATRLNRAIIGLNSDLDAVRRYCGPTFLVFSTESLSRNFYVHFGIEGGGASGDTSSFVRTTQPADATGVARASSNQIGIDVLIKTAVARDLRFGIGFKAISYGGGTASSALDADTISPGADTFVSTKFEDELMVYFGPVVRMRPIASWVMPYYGYSWMKVSGSVVTDQLGNVRQTDFSQYIGAHTFGLQLRHPIGNPLSSNLQAEVFGGVEAKKPDGFSFDHRAAFGSYNVHVNMDWMARAYVGAGVVFGSDAASPR